MWAQGMRTCDGQRFVEVVVTEPQGRTQLIWESAGDDEAGQYTLVAVARPPRYVGWYADDAACEIRQGAQGVECPVGDAPPPPDVPWGHLLP